MTTSQTSIHAAGARLTLVIACAALLLSGCAGTEPTIGHYYPECNTYCASVSAQANNIQLIKSVATGVGIGAVVGVGVGVALGDPGSGAIAGAAVGGAVGYGYFQKKLKEYQDPRQRYQSYLADVTTRTAATFALQRDVIAARNCYDQKWKEVIAQFDSGVVSKAETEERLKEIHVGLQQVKQIIAETRISLSAQREQIKDVMKAERDLPEETSQGIEQSEPDFKQNQERENGNAAQKQGPSVQNKKMGTRRLNEMEKRLSSGLTEQDQLLSAMISADKDRETRRYREASARALEI